MSEEERRKELADAVDDPIRMAKVDHLASILKRKASWRLRAILGNATERIEEESRMVGVHLEDKDYVWAADDIILLVQHLETVKQALLKAGFDPNEEPESKPEEK